MDTIPVSLPENIAVVLMPAETLVVPIDNTILTVLIPEG